MRRRKTERRLIAVGMNPDSTSYLIYSDDTEGRKRVYLDHLRRTGNRPDALRKAGATKYARDHWRRDDEEFRKEEEDAAYEAAGRHIRQIAAAARKDWKAAQQMVKMLAPEEAGTSDVPTVIITTPSRLARPNLTEIPVRDPDVDGEFREVPDAPTTAETEEEDPPQLAALPAPADATPQADGAADDGHAGLGHDSTRDHQFRADPGREPDRGA